MLCHVLRVEDLAASAVELPARKPCFGTWTRDFVCFEVERLTAPFLLLTFWHAGSSIFMLYLPGPPLVGSCGKGPSNDHGPMGSSLQKEARPAGFSPFWLRAASWMQGLRLTGSISRDPTSTWESFANTLTSRSQPEIITDIANRVFRGQGGRQGVSMLRVAVRAISPFCFAILFHLSPVSRPASPSMVCNIRKEQPGPILTRRLNPAFGRISGPGIPRRW